MTEREFQAKLAELDRLLNDPEIRMDPDRVWALLAEISAQEFRAPRAPEGKAGEKVFSPDPHLFLGVGTCRAASANPQKGRVGSGEGNTFPSPAFLIQATSNSPAAPWPPPMHIVITTYFAPRRLPSISAWPVIRAPLMP